jgi:vacuolar-type H+-ATPase subunit E/Vma4
MPSDAGGNGQMPSDAGGNGQMPSDAGGNGQMPSDAGGNGQMPSDAGGDGQMSSDGGGNGQMPSDAGGNGQMPSDAGGDGQMPSDAGGNGQMPSDAGGNGQMPSDAGGNGQMPSDAGGNDSKTVPEKPEGSGDTEQPADLPDGETGTEQVSETAILTIGDEAVITTAEGTKGSFSDIAEGERLTITLDDDGVVTSVVIGASMGMGMGGQSSGVTSYTAVQEYTEDASAELDCTSTGTDENAVHIYNGAAVSLTDSTITRTSSDSTGGDNSSFYGVGAAVLVSDGIGTIANSQITTDAAGGAGIFAYSTGVAYVKNTTIRTMQNTSGGIHAAGGGTLYAWDLDVETQGESSAAIRSDRGGGTMVVDGGTYVSNGTGSPAVYCTADIAVNNATLTSNAAEGICIEGKNSLHLFDCDLTANLSDDSRNDCTWSLIVYQSMSGDAEVGNSVLQLVGGSVLSKNGGLIYTTNTSSNILLSNVNIETAEDCEFFLKCTGNANERGWGQTGSNGAQCVFTGDAQIMNGDIIYDSISTLDCYLENGSVFTGAVVDDESCAGAGGTGYCNVTISRDSQWIVTGDSTLAELHNAGTIQDSNGQTVSVVGTDGTVYVQGGSSYTITVSSFDSNADFSNAGSVSSFAEYEVEMPQ